MGFVKKCSRTLLFFEKKGKPMTFLLSRAPDQIHPYQEEGPGGKVEESETIYEAAVREVREESGIIIDVKPHDFFYCGDNHFENHLGEFQESFFFLKLPFEVDQVITSKEHHKFRIVPYSDFFEANYHPGVKKFLLENKQKIDQWILKNFPSERDNES